MADQECGYVYALATDSLPEIRCDTPVRWQFTSDHTTYSCYHHAGALLHRAVQTVTPMVIVIDEDDE